MRTLLSTSIASLLLFAMSTSLKADYTTYQKGNCFYNPTVPANGAPLVANTQLSANGDCYTFKIWAAPYNEFGFDDTGAVRVLRSTLDPWQQCRFQNVLTRSKIEEHVYPFIDPAVGKAEITFQARCIKNDNYTGFDERVYPVECSSTSSAFSVII